MANLYLAEIYDFEHEFPLGVFSSVDNAHEACKKYIAEHYTFRSMNSAADYIITPVAVDVVL
jgi:hypothetical protein